MIEFDKDDVKWLNRLSRDFIKITNQYVKLQDYIVHFYDIDKNLIGIINCDQKREKFDLMWKCSEDITVCFTRIILSQKNLQIFDIIRPLEPIVKLKSGEYHKFTFDTTICTF